LEEAQRNSELDDNILGDQPVPIVSLMNQPSIKEKTPSFGASQPGSIWE
jgi:hypothetical protein